MQTAKSQNVIVLRLLSACTCSKGEQRAVAAPPAGQYLHCESGIKCSESPYKVEHLLHCCVLVLSIYPLVTHSNNGEDGILSL